MNSNRLTTVISVVALFAAWDYLTHGRFLLALILGAVGYACLPPRARDFVDTQARHLYARAEQELNTYNQSRVHPNADASEQPTQEIRRVS
jgi:hypothetical protein